MRRALAVVAVALVPARCLRRWRAGRRDVDGARRSVTAERRQVMTDANRTDAVATADAGDAAVGTVAR